MTIKLVDDYVNFIMDSMSQQIKEEMLYEYLVNEYKDLSEKELTQQILENYGDEWFEYVKENNWNDTLWKNYSCYVDLHQQRIIPRISLSRRTPVQYIVFVSTKAKAY